MELTCQDFRFPLKALQALTYLRLDFPLPFDHIELGAVKLGIRNACNLYTLFIDTCTCVIIEFMRLGENSIYPITLVEWSVQQGRDIT